MFALTTGTYRQLQNRICSDILTIKKQDPLASILIVSPLGRLLLQLQEKLAKESPGLLHIQGLTFFGLANRLVSHGWGPSSPSHQLDQERRQPAEGRQRQVAEPAIYEEIIRHLLEGRGDVPFESRAKLIHEGQPIPEGLPGALSATLKDLRDSGASVIDSLRAALEGHLGLTAPDAEPALELYARMHQTLEKHGLRTTADLLKEAAQRAPSHPFVLQQKAILLYGFYDVNGVQLDLVTALAGHSDARIYFPYQEGNPAYAYAERLLKDPSLHTKGEERRATSDMQDSSSLFAPRSTDIYSCSGKADEVWITAKKILEQMESGTPANRILVTARSLTPYVGIIRELFQTNHIPFAMDAEEPIGAYPRIKNALDTWLKNPDSVTATWQDHTLWAREQLERNHPLPEDALEIDTRLQDTLLTTLESLTRIDALGRPVSRHHFLKVLTEKISQLTILLAKSNNRGVQILDIMAARGLQFDSVFILGLNEKSFPRLIREDAFLADTARGALAQALGARLPRRLDGYPEERLLFQLACEIADKQLTITFQRSDEEGKAQVPSLYLREVGGQQHHLPRAPLEKWRSISASLLTPKELSILLNRNHLAPIELYEAVGVDTDVYRSLIQSQDRLETMQPLLGPHDGVIGPQGVLTAIHKKGYSPSSLKNLTDCPFRYFSRKILDIEENENTGEEERELPTDVEGKIIHRILELVYREKRSVDKACIITFGEYRETIQTLYPLLWKALRERIAVRVSHFLKLDTQELNESGYIPTYFEQEVSGHLPNLSEISFHGRIDRMDIKMEAGLQLCRVVDYKTGKPTSSKNKTETDVLRGKYPQLPIYMGIAGPWLEKETRKPSQTAESAYYNLADGEAGKKSPRLTPDFWETHGALYADNIRHLTRLVEQGIFYIRPSGERGPCHWCSYASACRKEHKPTAWRSEKSLERSKLEDKLKRLP